MKKLLFRKSIFELLLNLTQSIIFTVFVIVNSMYYFCFLILPPLLPLFLIALLFTLWLIFDFFFFLFFYLSLIIIIILAFFIIEIIVITSTFYEWWYQFFWTILKSIIFSPSFLSTFWILYFMLSSHPLKLFFSLSMKIGRLRFPLCCSSRTFISILGSKLYIDVGIIIL